MGTPASTVAKGQTPTEAFAPTGVQLVPDLSTITSKFKSSRPNPFENLLRLQKQESSTSSNGTTSHAPQPHKKPPPPPAVDPLVLKKPEDTISFKNEAKHVVKIERRDSDVEMNTHPPPSNPPPPKKKKKKKKS